MRLASERAVGADGLYRRAQAQCEQTGGEPTTSRVSFRNPGGLDATQRLRAVEAAVSSQELINALDDASPEVVRVAIRRLVELDRVRAAKALRLRVFDVDLALVADFAKALQRIGDDQILVIAIEALEDGRSTRRLAAIRAIGALRDERAVQALRAALDDDVAGVRAGALGALAQLAGGAGIPSGADCARLVSDPVPHVRVAAVRAVARLVAHPGPMLAPAVHDEDRVVRLAVAQYAASLPQGAARVLLEDPEARVREAAVRGAGKRELGALAVLLIDDPARDVRRAAARALGDMRDERAVELLLPSIEDPDSLVRAAVLHGLEDLLGREGVVRRLCDELAGKRAERRRASLYALARLNAREASAAVSRTVSDPDPEVRLALVHTAEALFDEPQPLVSYLFDDLDQAVHDAAEMWLLRVARTEP